MLQASDLTKAYDGAPLFDGLSFVLGDGERAGLVGPNGVGKSTLLKLCGGRRPARPAARRRPGPGERIGWLARRHQIAGATTLGELLGAGLGPVWTVRGELRGLEARLTAGDASPATLERYGQAQSRFEAPGGWAPGGRRSTRRAARWPSTTSIRRRRWARLSGGEQARALLAGAAAGRTHRPVARRADQPPRRRRAAPGWRTGCWASPARCSSSRTIGRSSTPSSGFVLDSSPVNAAPATRADYGEYRAPARGTSRAKLSPDYEAQEKRRRRLEDDIATTRRQAQHTERTVSRAAAPKLKRYAEKVARKAKAREGRLRTRASRATAR